MALEFWIDHRERDLIPLLEDIAVAKTLELGDAVFAIGGAPIAVFERKTWSDLAASIKDGRYRNQKNRLIEAYDARRVWYVFEGPGDFSPEDSAIVNGIPKSTLLSCVYSTAFRDGMNVARTMSVRDTADFLRGAFAKASAEAGAGERPREEQIVKRAVSSPREYFLRALCQVPGVSKKTAEAIAERFGTMRGFWESMRSCPEKLKVLKEIKTLDEKGGARRISSTVAKSLVEYLLDGGDSDAIAPV